MSTGLRAVAVGILGLAVSTGVIVQHRVVVGLREKLDRLREQRREIVQLRGENERLEGRAAEVAVLRQDDAALVQLQGEAATLQERRATEARAAAMQRWQAARAKLANLRTRYNDSHPSVAAQRAEVVALGAALGIAVTESELTVFDMNQLDRPPAPTASSRPVYPAELRREGIPGEVVVSFIVGANGEVTGARAAKSTQPEFEAPAVEAIKKWKFTPGQRTNLPVNVRVEIPIVFTLSGDGGSSAWF